MGYEYEEEDFLYIFSSCLSTYHVLFYINNPKKIFHPDNLFRVGITGD